MNIAFVTLEEPSYLPTFFARFFKNCDLTEHRFMVLIVPPQYKRHTKIDMARKYLNSFGMKEFLTLSGKIVHYTIRDKLSRHAKDGRFYSVKSVFDASGVEVYKVLNVNTKSTRKILSDFGVDVIVSVSCPQIFRKRLIELPPKGCLNLHGSKIPHYRGVFPSFWMLLHGEKTGYVTVFFMNVDVDAGEIAVQKSYPIAPDETMHSLIIKSKDVGCDAVIETLKAIDKGGVTRTPIDVSEGSYFSWPTREDVKKFLRAGKRFR